MKILHLFSNHKVTGPAEPVLRLAAELSGRGHNVLLAHKSPPRLESGYIDDAAEERDLRTTRAFRLPKHFQPLAIWGDVRRLAAFLDREEFDVVHCHLVNDHLTGALAAARSAARTIVVRTNHAAAPMPRDLRNRFLFPRRVDALVELSRAALEADVETFGLRPECVHLADTAIDLDRFDPGRDLPAMREELELRPDDYVVGIAARIQKRRRFDVLLDAAARAREQLPRLRLLIIGRGTRQRTVVVEPAKERGLDDITRFPGYLQGDDYVRALAALDVKIFLVPGTDGSCRALREAMALGRPSVVARRGMLPELVTDGADGLVIDDTPETLAEALVRLGRDVTLRRRMGEAARRTALERFDPARQAARVEEIYERSL
jgi:glycosyltransferase involved in cell wall biosynthesis